MFLNFVSLCLVWILLKYDVSRGLQGRKGRGVISSVLWMDIGAVRTLTEIGRLIRLKEDIPDVSPFITVKGIISGQSLNSVRLVQRIKRFLDNYRSLQHVTLIMCHCEDMNSCKQSLLTNRVDSLYDNELDSDVVFLVGVEPDVWRIPGHKRILSEANPVFRALLEGPLATQDKTIVVNDVESRAFDYLLRYLYGKKVYFQSASTALSTLYAAHKYLSSGLIELCVKYLDENLNVKNVIEIYTHAMLYAVGENRREFQPSAPVLSTESQDLLHTPTHCYPPSVMTNNNNNMLFDKDDKCLQAISIPFWSGALVHNCLQYIDENADQILNQECIEDMSPENLEEIVKRDTLKIKSEYVVFLALDRWANRECKRRKLNLSSKNRRLVLGDLIYAIRFPFFTSDEFILGPIQSGLLNQQELTVFSAFISKSKNVPSIPHSWKHHMEKVSKKRIYNENESVTLSQRTYLIETEKEKDRDLRKNYSIFKKIKNKNNKSTKDKNLSKGDENDRSCMKCFPDCMIDILVCLFD